MATENKKYTSLAVAGAGLAGKKHIDAILYCKKAKLVAIVDPLPQIKDYAKELGRAYYPSISELLKNQEVDGLVIATPNNCHVSDGLEAIKKLCPILVEKPIATTSKEAEILVAAAEKKNVPLLVGHHRRHNPLIKVAYDTIKNGDIGKIRGVNVQCWLYKPEAYFEESPWRKSKGAGPVTVNFVHDIDLLHYLCGRVVSVYAEKSPSLRGYENEDIASAILRFENDALCTISVSDTIVAPWSWELTAKENEVYPPTNESSYLIGGTEGALSIPDLRLWKNPQGLSWKKPISAIHLMKPISDPLHNQIDHFVDVIRGSKNPILSGREALKNIQVIEAIAKSAQQKQTVFFK
jgi:predicted dehydrogenase